MNDAPYSGKHVELTYRANVADVVWRSERLNLFTPVVADELAEVFSRVSASSARAMLLRAVGKVFCGGVDVSVFTSFAGSEGADFSGRSLALVRQLEDLPIPTIAAIHAKNLTIGLELALGCDIILASPDASMGLVEVNVGLTPAGGGLQRLVARVGLTKATRMVFFGEVVSAADLQNWGLVDSVVDQEHLLNTAQALAGTLGSGPTQALIAAKTMLRISRDHGVNAADAATPGIAGPIMSTHDAQVGTRALLHREQPSFVGR